MLTLQKVADLKRHLLLVSVFISGSAVLIIEVVATRILSPYYGNTIYTTSSVIGTVLAALSLGYYIGGITADRFPKCTVFYGIIGISGFFIISIELFSLMMLPTLSGFLSLALGPVISSVVLFFLPAFVLATLSPFAIKLNEKGNETIGKQSGQVFFWSTLGSIAGSFLAGFYLIPNFGISNIILFIGFFLGLWGIAGATISGLSFKRSFFLFLTLLFFGALVTSAQNMPNNVIYEKDGVYERIRITDGVWNGHSARFLFQDRSYSAAMYLGSDDLVYDYTKYYKLYQLFNDNPSRALVIGGGAYSIPKAILHDSQNTRVDVAEIEPGLYDLAKMYFRLSDSDRLHNYVEDGRRLLDKTTNKYDVIIGDGYYSLFSIPIHLTTKEFFALAKERLSDNGVFIGNFSGNLSQGSPSFIFSEIRTFRDVFSNSYFFAVRDPNQPVTQNIIFLGIKGSQRINFQDQQIVENRDPIISTLASKNIDLASTDLLQYKEITDDYAPVEYMIGRVVNQWR